MANMDKVIDIKKNTKRVETMKIAVCGRIRDYLLTNFLK